MALIQSSALLASLIFVSTSASACGDLLNTEFRPLAGDKSVNLCEMFEGQVLLVVNTASKCGFTPQYEGLEALHKQFNSQGFAVIGFPSNDFMGQEPGTEEEIKEFCSLTYGVKFPMFEKVSVKQGIAHPFYDALAAQAKGEYPGWNFHKYLINRKGEVVASFGSRTKPDDEVMVAKIKVLLAEKGQVESTAKVESSSK